MTEIGKLPVSWMIRSSVLKFHSLTLYRSVKTKRREREDERDVKRDRDTVRVEYYTYKTA